MYSLPPEHFFPSKRVCRHVKYNYKKPGIKQMWYERTGKTCGIGGNAFREGKMPEKANVATKMFKTYREKNNKKAEIFFPTFFKIFHLKKCPDDVEKRKKISLY